MQMISFIFIYVLTTILISLTISAPTVEKLNATNNSITESDVIKQDVQLVQPHIITIDRLESLLKRAGEIFRPVIEPLLQVPSQQPEPFENLQPPTEHPYNFYLPPFNYHEEDGRLDEKSLNIMKLTPPPATSGKVADINYYITKPKKLPKKFSATEKLVNINWLNAFEREALADTSGHIPKAVYLAEDERNRINFDDSFFAVDMYVHPPADNNPHKEIKNGDGEQEFTNPEEGEDLIAAPAAHLPQILLAIKNERI